MNAQYCGEVGYLVNVYSRKIHKWVTEEEVIRSLYELNIIGLLTNTCNIMSEEVNVAIMAITVVMAIAVMLGISYS